MTVPYFDDDACVTPIEVASFRPVVARRQASSRAESIGALRTRPIYELTTGDRCAAYTPPARFAIHDLASEPASDIFHATRELD